MTTKIINNKLRVSLFQNVGIMSCFGFCPDIHYPQVNCRSHLSRRGWLLLMLFFAHDIAAHGWLKVYLSDEGHWRIQGWGGDIRGKYPRSVQNSWKFAVILAQNENLTHFIRKSIDNKRLDLTRNRLICSNGPTINRIILLQWKIRKRARSVPQFPAKM